MSTQTPAHFGASLKRHRLAAGLTQEALAERAGLGVRSIQALERGESRPLRDTLRRLADTLAVPEGERARFLAVGTPAPRRSSAPDAGAATPPAVPHNLPLQLTSFVGRAVEIAEVTGLLASTRLLTLTGTGGVGKTRLALQVAASLLDRYPDGIRLVELAPLADPTLVPSVALAALGVREQPGCPPLETLLEALRTREPLLLLDNCEHLLDACARLAEALLRACPHLQILATSREPLGLAGEMSWRVPSLSLPATDQHASPELIARCEAVQLFLDRARSVQPHFALTAANAPALAGICARLDGIPLALELAASQVRALGPAALAARLDQRFRLLTGGSRTALPRQQTLRATVEWSYDLLTERERTLFERLAVFQGGFTLEAAEAVCAGVAAAADRPGPVAAASPLGGPREEDLAGEDVLDLLVRLVDKSLVVADEAEGEVTRYRLLETLRQYGRERLEPRTDAAAVQWRHAAHYLALAEEAERHLTGPEQWPWRARLAAERGNLRAALRWFLEHGAADESLRLAVALDSLWIAREGYSEGKTGLEEALALPGAASHRARARALVGFGFNMSSQVNASTTRRLLEEALTLGRELDERPTMARALLGLGMLAICQGDYPRARTLLEESLVLYRPLGDSWGIAKALGDLGRVVNLEGDHVRAHTLLDEALALARRTDEHQMVAFALEVRGEVAFATGDDAAAGRLWEDSLDRYNQLGITLGVASLEIFLGLRAIRLGDYATALARYRSSLKHQRGWVYWAIRSLAGLAAVAVAGGQDERALRLAGAGLALGEGVGFQLPAPEREVLERAVEAARAALGKQAATAAWAEGQAMTLEQAVAHAMETA